MSNKNIFYAATPSTTNVLYYDGSNSDQTLTALQTRFLGRENYSHTEDVAFVNAADNDLHITAGTSSFAESAAALLPSVSTDIDGQIRPGPLGSIFGGGLVSADIGADEFDGIVLSPYGDITAPAFSIDSIVPTLNTCLSNPHIFYVKIYDASIIDTAIINWTLGNLGAQTPVSFTNISGNRYFASIPSYIDSSISYSFRIVDGSINKNATTVAGGTYKDVAYKVLATTSNNLVSAGTPITLAVLSSSNVQLGTGTTVNSTSSNAGAAYPTYYGNGRQQYLITANEITALGLSAGEINSLGFFVTIPGTGVGATLNGYTIKLAQTSLTNLSSGIQNISANTLFGPVNYTPIVGLNTHAFTNAFIWDGSSNIIVDICFSNQITGSTTTQNIVRTSATSFVSSAYYQIDGTAGAAVCTSTSLTSSVSIRPNFYIKGSKTVNNATWSASVNAGLQSATGNNVIAIPQSPGTYNYQVTASNGTCSSQSSVTVTALAPAIPIADFTASAITATTGSVISTITFSDNSLNLPSTWKWSFSPATVNYVNSTSSNSKNPQVQFNAFGTYSVKLVVTNITGSDSLIKLNYITVNPGYCITSLHTTASACIDSLMFGNIINQSGVTCALPSYSFKPTTTTVMRLVPTPITVKTAASAIVSVWIDYNKNSIFESSEWTQVYTTGTRGTKNIIIPASAVLGQTTMRVRSRAVGTLNGSTDACTSFTSGETEDYAITIISTSGDYYPPDFAANHIINPAGGTCNPSAHTVSINITDTTGVDSAFLIWSVNAITQTPLVMTNTNNIYAAIIPAQNAGASVQYSFLAKDSSPNKNIGTQIGGNYTDATFRIKSITSADSVNTGTTIQLGVSNPIIKIGNGTTTNSTTSNIGAAYPTYYGNGRQQYLILASELSALGLNATSLNSLAFDVSTIGVGTGASLSGYTIKLGNTNNSTLASTFNTTALTTVFSAVNYTPTVGSNVHAFLSPYFWDGISNLIVDICFSNGITGTSTIQNTNKTHITTFPSSVYYQVDGTAGSSACTSTTVSSSVAIRPNMLFTSVQQNITYTWSVGLGGNLSATNIVNPTATPTAPGVYYYKVLANNGLCVFADSIRVKVINPTKPVANFNASTNTGFTNSPVQFNDQTTNLPQTWKWIFSPSTVTYNNLTTSTSKNPIVNFTNSGLYSVKLVTTNTAGADSITKTSYIRILTSPCTASLHTSSSPCLSSVILNTISTSGGACALPSYSLESATTNLLKLATYPLSVSTSTSAITSVWIDFNQNGTFESTEWWQIYTNASTGTINITLPSNAIAGYTLMRIRSRSTGSPNGAIDACTSFASGETKDFIINIVNPVGDYYPPVISNIQASPAISCNAVSHTVTASVYDTTGVDSVLLYYSLSGIVQSPIMMSLTTGNIYTALIPAAGSALVSYRIYAVDNSAQKNNILSAATSYRDAQLKTTLTLGPDLQIPIGGTAQLSVQFPFIIGNGTSPYTLSNASNVFDRYYGGRKTQYLYLASELQAAGLSAGPINSLSFFANANQITPTALPDFSVEMKAVTLTSLTGGTFETAATNVFGPTNFTPSIVNNKMAIPFTNTFNWDGTSSILVSVCWTKVDGGTTLTSTNESVFLAYTTTPANTVVYRRVDNTPISTIYAYTTGGTNTALRANVEFGSSSSLYVYNWTQPSNGGLSSTNIANPTVSPSGGLGTYQYIVSVNDGNCTALDTINVAVVSAPIVNLGNSGDICGSTARVLDAGNPGATYQWTFNGAAFGTTQTVQAINAGVYKVSVTNVSNITVSDSITLAIAPEFTVSIANKFLCIGGAISVSPGTYSSYLWSNGATTPSIQITTLGNYFVTVKNARGCTATASFEVLIGTAPTVNLGPNQSICKSNAIVLNALNPGATYLWSTGAITQSINVSNAGIYWLKVTNAAGCFALDTIEITNLAAPLVNLGPDKQECSGVGLTLDAGNPGASYLWNTGATTKTINVTTAGIFMVSVTNAGGCSTKDTIVITRFAPLVVNLGSDMNICTSDTITLDAGNPGATYLWNTGATTKTIRISSASTFSVTVTNSLGCIGTDEIVVTNKAVPNSVFSFTRLAGRSVKFNCTPTGGQTYSWNFGDPNSASNISAITNPIHEFSTSSTFIVTLTVTNISTNCVSITKDTLDLSVGINTNGNEFDVNVYPNPITDKSILKYTVIRNNSNVVVDVYNALGQKVYALVNTKQLVGKHEFDLSELMDLNEHSILFLNINIDGSVITKKLILSTLK